MGLGEFNSTFFFHFQVVEESPNYRGQTAGKQSHLLWGSPLENVLLLHLQYTQKVTVTGKPL